jgi:predicted acetyltransferase
MNLSQTRRTALEKVYRSGFPDDKDSYVRYFFDKKIANAEIFTYTQNRQIVSSGYIFNRALSFCGETVTLPFLVAAATLSELRGQGIFQRVMRKIFQKNSELPFIALNTYDRENYYRRAFGFSTFNTHRHLSDEIKNVSDFCTIAQKNVLNLKEYDGANNVSEECQTRLASVLSRVYTTRTGEYLSAVLRDEEYFCQKIAEVFSDGGRIYLIEKLSAAVGYLCAEGHGTISEICFESGEFETCEIGFSSEDKRAMMIRILDVSRVLSLVCKGKKCSFSVRINDAFFPKNRGIYTAKFDGKNGTVERVSDRPCAVDFDLTIEELCALIFDKNAEIKKENADLHGLLSVGSTFSLEEF